MALILTAFDLVVRVDALSAGCERFAESVPNPTFCTDGRIARASFMVEEDRRCFASSLAVPAEAIGLADKRTCSVNVAWLECGRYAGVDAVWVRGEPPEPLVVPVRWKPGELSFGTAEEMAQQMEYLGSENGVEVYLDRRTGQKRYTGRTRPSLDPAEAKRLDALRSEASVLVGRSLLGHGPLGFLEKRRLRRGIALLEQITAVVPDHWPSHWTIGMSWRRLGEEEAALTSLRRAYELEKTNPDVGRECAGQCFRLGLGRRGCVSAASCTLASRTTSACTPTWPSRYSSAGTSTRRWTWRARRFSGRRTTRSRRTSWTTSAR